MIRTIDEIKEIFTSDDFNKDTVLADITDTLADQKLKYVSKDKEALKVKSALKSMGYNKDEHGDLDAFTNHINELKSKTINNSEAITKLTLMESKLKEYETKESNWKRESERSKLTDTLTTELGSKLKGSKYIINDLITSGKVKLVDSEVVFMDGETPTLFKNGIEKVLADNADLLISEQNPGANTKGRTNTTTNNKAISLADINKMTPEQIKENMESIRSLGRKTIGF